MKLIFDPNPPFLRWLRIEDGNLSEGRIEFGPEWFRTATERIGDVEKAEAIGYLLYHGGEVVKKPASFLSAGSLTELEKCTKFLPEYNDPTFKVAQYLVRRLPDARHILFCDTAFFANLPDTASMYAVPYELREKGVRRYGGYGLCHEQAWERARASLGKHVDKVISVYLGDRTNIAAIGDGKPLETTIGFTSIEGIPSSTGCGDIDPTVIFNLNATGMSFDEINRILSRESGFTGLLGRKCGFLDILQGKDDAEVSAVREIFCYNILRYIGAFISTMGGVDAIIFVSENAEEAMDFIVEICRNFGFLGLKCKTDADRGENFWNLTESDSKVAALCMKYDKWEIIAKKADRLLT